MKSNNKLMAILLCSIFSLTFGFSYSQTSNKTIITGKVIEEGSKEALQYVNVAILGAKNKLINGISTDEKGFFSLREGTGKYKIRFTFIGYKDTVFTVDVKGKSVNLGTIAMKTNSSTLKGVEITAERSMMEYKLDKRVINVDKNLVSAGGSASDVLENVPSVTVDEDGSVSLRGNSNVKVLIDGKPSELLGNDLATVLAQIPASSIENVEVITNPSAKYDPEGMSGIINIKLKEKGNKGLNGNVSISGGSAIQKAQPQTSFSGGLNYSTKKFALNASIDARYNKRGHYRDQIKTLFNSSNSADPINAFVYSKRDDYHKMLGGGFKLGGDWYINDKNTLTLSYNAHLHSTPDESGTIVNKDLWNSLSSRSLKQTDDGNDNGLFQTIAMNYTKKFDKKDQELSIDANFNHGSFKRKNNELFDYDIDIPDYKFKDDDNDHFNRVVATVNYAHPFTKDMKLELGYNLNYGKSNSDYSYYFNDSPIKDSTSYSFEQEEAINAFYGTFGWTIGKFSTQLGLRYEIVRTTGTKTMIDETSVSNSYNHFKKDYSSLFPSLHFSYAITPMQSAQLSYSRRIQRPDPWNLMPNVDFSNPEQLRFGNPDLNPEYTNSFELGYNIIFPKTTIFASAYYRQTDDRIGWFSFLWTAQNAHRYGFDWVLDVAGEDTTRLAQTSMNIAKSSNYGLELIVDQQLASWWKINVNANLFGSYQDGTTIGANEVKSLNFDCKLNSTMTLKKDWIIQISAQYYAPQKTIQGDMKAQIFSDLAIKHTILDKKGTISLSFRDIFNTRARISRTLTADYFTYTYSKGYSQTLTLSFSYMFGQRNMNKERQKKQQPTENVGSGLESSGEDF